MLFSNPVPVSLIAAVAPNLVIGRDGKLPWHCPAELALFQKTTKGGVLIMGRKTWESLDKPLAGREVYVVTSNSKAVFLNDALDRGEIKPAYCYSKSLEAVLSDLKARGNKRPVFICGGAELYKTALQTPEVTQMYLSHMDAEYDGDVYFPPVSWSEWDMVEMQMHHEFNHCKYVRR